MALKSNGFDGNGPGFRDNRIAASKQHGDVAANAWTPNYNFKKANKLALNLTNPSAGKLRKSSPTIRALKREPDQNAHYTQSG